MAFITKLVSIMLKVWNWMFPKWYKEDGVIYFTVISSGWTGEEWIEYFKKLASSDWVEFLKQMGWEIDGCTEEILRSPGFKPTKKGVKTKVAVLPWSLFEDDARTTSEILAYAERRGFTRLKPNVACLIRKKFTDREIAEMGLGEKGDIVVMSEPLNNSDGRPSLLATDSSWKSENMGSYFAGLSKKWPRKIGFAFGDRVLS